MLLIRQQKMFDDGEHKEDDDLINLIGGKQNKNKRWEEVEEVT